VIDEATTTHFAEALGAKELAADGRAHDAQVKGGPASKVCAWKRPGCSGHYSGPKPGPGVEVSHGMCSSCFAIVSHEDAQGRPA
jgi:hypothetical protein